MRERRFIYLLISILAGCSTTPAITVTHYKPGDKPEAIAGDAVKTRRGPQEAYAGARGGFFAIRGLEDWRLAWVMDNAPPLPAGIDTSRQMLLLAVSETAETSDIRIQKVIETGNYVHVWVKETRVGEGCAPKKERSATDAVVVERMDKPVKFYVETGAGETCGAPPTASVECRVGQNPTWSKDLSAQPGETVECMLTADAKGKFVLVDRALGVAELPGGSAAKLAYVGGPLRGSFLVDVYGTYTMRAEASDEAGRKGMGTAKITVLPPKSRDVVVQLVWTNFDAADEPDTFPRTKLRALEKLAKGDRAKPRECNAESSPPKEFCEVRTQSAYTHMTLKASDKTMPISVRYTDERVDKGPLVCLHVYFDGARQAETCDRKHRNAEDTWEVGLLDMTTGRFDWQPPPTAHGADGGAPTSGATDAGATPAKATGDAGAALAKPDAGGPAKPTKP